MLPPERSRISPQDGHRERVGREVTALIVRRLGSDLAEVQRLLNSVQGSVFLDHLLGEAPLPLPSEDQQADDLRAAWNGCEPRVRAAFLARIAGRRRLTGEETPSLPGEVQ